MTGFVEFDATGDNARLLLAVAELLGHPVEAVRTNSDGMFEVPDDVLDGYMEAKKAEAPAARKQTRRQPGGN